MMWRRGGSSKVRDLWRWDSPRNYGKTWAQYEAWGLDGFGWVEQKTSVFLEIFVNISMVFLEVSCVLPAPHTSLTNLKGWNVFVLSGTPKRSRRYYSGQIITTSAEVTLDDCDCKGIAPKCPKHSGLGIILICLDYCNGIHTQKWRWTVVCWCAFSRMILRFKIFIFWGEVSLPIPPTPIPLFVGKIAGDTRCNMAMASAVLNGFITSPAL